MTELKTIRYNKMAGTRIRSRARRIEEDEKPMRYFIMYDFYNNVMPTKSKYRNSISYLFDILNGAKIIWKIYIEILMVKFKM